MTTPEQQGSAQIGVTGMGVMGRNLARNFARHGYRVALHNRTASKTADVAQDFGDEGTFLAAVDRRRVRAGPGAAAKADHHGQRRRRRPTR